MVTKIFELFPQRRKWEFNYSQILKQTKTQTQSHQTKGSTSFECLWTHQFNSKSIILAKWEILGTLSYFTIRERKRLDPDLQTNQAVWISGIEINHTPSGNWFVSIGLYSENSIQGSCFALSFWLCVVTNFCPLFFLMFSNVCQRQSISYFVYTLSSFI